MKLCDVFVVCDDGTILHYDGNTWSEMDKRGTDVILNGIWGSASTEVFAVGRDSTLLRYDGNSWALVIINE